MTSEILRNGFGPIRQVILQATTFCNIACRYCYLDSRERSTRKMMSDATARQAFEWVASTGALAGEIDFRWHAGEPLTRGIPFYHEAYRAARQVFAGQADVRFSIQTNGILINDPWCDFFRDAAVSVGISIDGDQAMHDEHRTDRSGRGTWISTMKGISRLRCRQIPFSTICVLTRRSLSEPDRIFAFFRELGCVSVGFNYDDLAIRPSSQLDDQSTMSDYVSFMERVLELEEQSEFSIRVREFDQLRHAILATNGAEHSTMAHPFAILSVGVNGELSTCSPELLTLTPPLGDPMVLGTVWHDTPGQVVATFRDSPTGVAIQAGNARCHSACEFYGVCGGGSPVNRLYEHGSCEVPDTFYCESRIKRMVPVVLQRLEQDRNYLLRSRQGAP
jgi:uncharacterized protein